ncbi:CRISPR-associated helicase Cas3' [Synoicihabitans lomoniglobus]|uniref:CRISPR-associated helicase Cas3 n=1 Tax=Synoicihabitans lomoniglobus TaxID=2909285 RepID=A0AAF0A046_9BACT|nr:CRISPR-associated helicase Cas3' [Opitutaceae bacterium LMO-M01]WED64753.1 CRISPR-associated helicase Cas3' [Opitutaceae bacterium LMO-M01]
MTHYAHTTDGPSSTWEPLFTPDCATLTDGHCSHCAALERDHGHLNKVAHLASEFAAAMFPPGPDRESAREWGRLTGLWHDLGKFAPEWQTYLKSKADPHASENQANPPRKEDHSTAGAVHSHGLTPFGDLLSYIIAGHHAGLADANQLFTERLPKSINEWRSHAESAAVPLTESIPAPPLSRSDAGNDGMAFMLRFFFSCLVDADFLATESFMQPKLDSLRQPWPEDTLFRMLVALETHLEKEFGSPGEDPVNQARDIVRHDCIHAAENEHGFFSLTVPTGGGKTLSSLLFALRHALRNGQQRVVLVIPFTSIIKQNADVFRQVFCDLSNEMGREIVLEHHSKFDPRKETEQNRLAAENWDAPLVVTTNVQFFESLFANRTSACRKLHRIARSVLIFDEVQALPSSLLHPILRALRCLVHDLHSTAVLCTATQPAVDRRDDFDIGIPPEEITAIIRDESALFHTLERVTSQDLGLVDDDQLLAHLLPHAASGCLLILNTTKAARTFHEKLSHHTNALHLSARMCPAHVVAVLDAAKTLRKSGQSVVLVSTQLIEAGVDISFPTVYRAECGLDSFAQAAGRCNRNGELKTADGTRVKGRVFLFSPTDHPIPKGLADISANAAITRAQILPNLGNRDLLDPPLIRTYFEHAIWQAGPKTDRWDKPHIVSGEACFNPNDQSDSWARTYKFKTAAERFRLIDTNTHPVLIPWGVEGQQLAQEIRDLKKQNRVPNRSHYRRAQQFTVQVYDGEWQHLKTQVSLHCEEAFAILEHPENAYHPQTGLKRPDAPSDPNAFCL